MQKESRRDSRTSWAMISSEVQRTLVKSPPELWAELSDPAALARHLCELGEIKITKIEPEQTVEWEAEAAKGKVELKPSGWGTKVTLSVTQELPGGVEQEEEADPPASGLAEEEPEVVDEQAQTNPAEVESEQGMPATEVPAPAATEADDHADAVQAEPHDAAPVGASEATPRQGFFARLFRRKARTANVAEPAAAAEPNATEGPPAVEEPIAVEQPAGAQEPGLTDESESPAEEQPPDLAAELAAAEEALAAQTTEMLTLALDRLGAAHHRPFSRA